MTDKTPWQQPLRDYADQFSRYEDAYTSLKVSRDTWYKWIRGQHTPSPALQRVLRRHGISPTKHKKEQQP